MKNFAVEGESWGTLWVGGEEGEVEAEDGVCVGAWEECLVCEEGPGVGRFRAW